MKIVIEIPLITHVAKTKNKIAADKYMKINNQAIYNDMLSRFSRSIVMGNLHEHITNHVSKALCGLNINEQVKLKYEFHTVINHETIRNTKKGISWKPSKEDYLAGWDLDNLAFIWIKAMNDTINKLNVINNDTVRVIRKTSYKLVEVEDLSDLKIILKIKSI